MTKAIEALHIYFRCTRKPIFPQAFRDRLNYTPATEEPLGWSEFPKASLVGDAECHRLPNIRQSCLLLSDCAACFETPAPLVGFGQPSIALICMTQSASDRFQQMQQVFAFETALCLQYNK